MPHAPTDSVKYAYVVHPTIVKNAEVVLYQSIQHIEIVVSDVVSEDSSIPLEVDLENNYVHEVNCWKWLCRSDIPR